MVTVKNAEFFIGIITFLVAYLIAVTGANFVRAVVAKAMGDDSAEQLGFLTLNPLVHLDPLGLAVLFLFYSWGNYFGWGRHVPINPFNIENPWRGLKLTLVYLSDTIAHFCMALSGIVMLEVLFDGRILGLVRYMVLSRTMSHLLLAHSYPAHSSLVVAVGFIIIALVYLNVVLGVLYFIINCRDIFMIISSESPLVYEERRMQLSNVIIPMLLVIFFSEPLRHLAVWLIVYAGYIIAHVMHII